MRNAEAIFGGVVYVAEGATATFYRSHVRDGQGADLLAPIATITITDDEPLPTLTVANASVPEGDEGTTPLLFAVSLSHASAFPVTVEYSTGDGGDTAVADVDYQFGSDTLTIPAGQTVASIVIHVNGDTVEEEEQFALDFYNPQGEILATPSATGTIVDDDGDDGYQIFLPIVIR